MTRSTVFRIGQLIFANLRPSPSVHLPVLLVILGATTVGQQVYEDWACYTFTAATSVAGGKTNLTCNAAHGWTTGQQVIMWGATGSWVGLNTELDQTVSNGEAIGATDTKILVNDTSKVLTPSIMLIDSEQMRIDHTDAHYLYIAAGSGCTGGTNGRGCNGTTATTHIGTDASGIMINYGQPAYWTATVIDSMTVQIGFDSSSAGSFAGQSVYVSRSQPGDLSSPLVRPYMGQPWAISLNLGSNGMTINVPACQSTTDPYLCSYGFDPAINGKGYNINTTQVTSLVFSGTFPNQTATITFASPYVDSSPNGVLQPLTSTASPMGGLVFLADFDETSTCTSCLNHAYIVQSVTYSGSNKVGAVLIPGGNRNVTNGTYTASNSAGICNRSKPPCLVMPIAGDGYTDTNPSSGGTNYYPSGTVQTQIIHGGTWNPVNNRLTWMVQYNGINRSGVSNDLDMGTYDYFGSDTSDIAHMYHSSNPNFVSGKWIQIDYTATWDHVVGAGATNYANDASYTVPGWLQSPAWRGGQRHYYDALQRFYWDDSGNPNVNAPIPGASGSTRVTKYINFWYAPNQPEEFVMARSALYDGTEYQFSWTGPPQDYGLPQFSTVYNLAYSTASNCASQNYSSGTSMGSVTQSAGGARNLNVNSPAMAESATVCLYIRPMISVTNISLNGNSPIWLWTPLDTNMQVGDHITTTGIGGNGNVTNTAINSVQYRQMWSVRAPNSTQPWTGTGTMTSIVSDSTAKNCTVTLTVNHNLAPGWPITVFNPPSGFGTASNYYTTVSSTPTSNTFVFPCASGATPSSTFNSDPDTTDHFGIESYPGISISGTGSGLSLSSGTIVSTEASKNFAVIAFSDPGLSAGGTSSSTNPCDVNKDGVVNLLDVQLTVNAVLGLSSIQVDLTGSGTTNITDVQRVISAALGGACVTGP